MDEELLKDVLAAQVVTLAEILRLQKMVGGTKTTEDLTRTACDRIANGRNSPQIEALLRSRT